MTRFVMRSKPTREITPARDLVACKVIGSFFLNRKPKRRRTRTRSHETLLRFLLPWEPALSKPIYKNRRERKINKSLFFSSTTIRTSGIQIFPRPFLHRISVKTLLGF
jgi:hypothetical protein